MNDDYFILNNGESSLDNDIVVVELPSITRPKPRIEEIEVLGMDGALTVSDGTYEPLNKVCRVYYNGTDYDNLIDYLEESGIVVFSNISDRYYNYKIISEIPLSEIIENEWYEFNIVFRCQPFGYSIYNDPITITAKNTEIFNFGTYYSKPIIKIYGTGNINLLIDEQQVSLTAVDSYITIDTNKLRTSKDTVRQNEKKVGNYPILKRGVNNITWDGNVTKIEIIPNWRYLI